MGLMDMFGGGGGTSGEYIPPQPYIHPQYSFTEPRLQGTSDFIAGNIANLQEGKMPSYYANALPELRSNMQRGLQQTYFGSPGMGGQGGGVMGQIRESGATLGTGPRNTVNRENKALYDYAEKEKAIDEYLTKLGVGIQSQAAYQQPMLSMQMPQGPEMSMLPAQQIQGTTQSNPWSSILSLVGGGQGLMNMGQGILGMFSGNNNNPQNLGSLGAYNAPSGEGNYQIAGSYGDTNPWGFNTASGYGYDNLDYSDVGSGFDLFGSSAQSAWNPSMGYGG